MGVPCDLRREVSVDLSLVSERLTKDDFYRPAADFNSDH